MMPIGAFGAPVTDVTWQAGQDPTYLSISVLMFGQAKSRSIRW